MLERLNEYSVTTKTVDAFGGLDRRKTIAPGSFSDMNNMTGDDLPVISVRKKRAKLKNGIFGGASGMNEVNGDLYFFAKSESRNDSSYSLYKNGVEITEYAFDSRKKKTAVMGADIIVFPDKIKYGTLSGRFESLVSSFSSAVEVTLCDSLYKNIETDGSVRACICLTEDEMNNVAEASKSGEKAVNSVLASHAYSADSIILYCPTISVFKKAVLSDGMYSPFTSAVSTYNAQNDSMFYDLRGEELYIRKKDSDGNTVYGKDIAYLRLSGNSIGSLFSQWDSIDITADAFGALGTAYLSGTKTVIKSDAENDCIYISGVTDSVSESYAAGQLTVTRPVPDMDMICSYENRLYGCCFKKIEGNSQRSLNEIYVSKLGEPGNFSLSDSDTGAYALSVGENGEFTAVCGYNGYVCFFKETCVIMLDRYFSSSVIKLDGVNVYGGESTAQTDGKLIYTGTNGIYMFNGNTSVKISEKLGDFDIVPICACANDGKYYLNCISMREYDSAQSNPDVKANAKSAAQTAAREKLEASGIKNTSVLYKLYLSLYTSVMYPMYLISAARSTFSQSQMYVYDLTKNVWTKENVGRTALCMTADAGNVYYIDSSGVLYAQYADGGKIPADFEDEENIEWYIVSGDIGYSVNSQKYISRIGIRIKPETGTVVNVEIEYDSSGDFTRIFTLRDAPDSAVTLPIIPARCDHIKIRLSGTGGFSLLGAFADFEEGSEIL